jgi:DNA-binding transcriptional LysR family regulator
MHDLNDLYFFVHVVEHGGFAAAGRALGVPKSRLSRRIALLEERLGVRLLQRSTRCLAVTEVGQAYFGHCKAILVQAEAAQEAIERSLAEPSGVVRMTCPVTLLETTVGPMLAGFLVAHPRVWCFPRAAACCRRCGRWSMTSPHALPSSSTTESLSASV